MAPRRTTSTRDPAPAPVLPGPTAANVLLHRAPPPAWDQLEVAMGAAAKIAGLRWGPVVREVARRTNELLDLELADLVVGAWEKAGELGEYADPEKTPPGETVVTEMGEHSIDLEYHPSLSVLVNEARLPDLSLDIELSLIVKGMILTLRGGEIRRMRSGSMEATGSIEAAGVTIVERESEPVELPGEWLAEGETPDPPQVVLEGGSADG